MHGTLAMTKRQSAGELVTITPQLAQQYLEHNQHNRPITDSHVRRIASQIIDGKWRFNGDTIKISDTGDVLDGQHRLWAVITSEKPIETIVVTGIEKEAFATIDTLRKPRSAADLIALKGQVRHRNIVAGALTWLVRWQRKDAESPKLTALPKYKEPQYKVENSDIEAAFETHRNSIMKAVEVAMTVRRVANPSLIAFVYYVASNQNLELAEQLIGVLDNPARTPAQHPLFQLREMLIRDKNEANKRRRDPVVTIALCFKALNVTAQGQTTKLGWISGGKKPEPFPVLAISGSKARKAT